MAEERMNRLDRWARCPAFAAGLGGVAAAALTTLGLAAEADAKKKKKKKKKKPTTPVCTPQSQATTCAGGKCGSVANNCGQQVNCGACTTYAFDTQWGGAGSGDGKLRRTERRCCR